MRLIISGNMDKVLKVPNGILMPEIDRMLRSGTKVTLRTKGDSMFPFIRGGRDSVVLEYDPQPRPGDIVLAMTDAGNYVLHRLMTVDGEAAVLMGDGNVACRESCSTGAICGKVVRIIRAGREVDPYSPVERAKAAVWMRTVALRRWMLAVVRRLTRLRMKIRED